jgi:hypothetical protein
VRLRFEQDRLDHHNLEFSRFYPYLQERSTMNWHSIAVGVILSLISSGCAPIATAPAVKPTGNVGSVRFSAPVGDASVLELSNFEATRVTASGQSVGGLYLTQINLELGGGTANVRGVSLQISAKLSTGFTCTLSTVSIGAQATGNSFSACDLIYSGGKTTLKAASGTFSVTSLEAGTLRFTAVADLKTAGTGGVKLELTGKVDNFAP